MHHLTEVLNPLLRDLAATGATSHYWLGVDGGGTKTKAMLFAVPADSDADLLANVVGEGLADAANFHRVGVASAAHAVQSAIEQACHQAGIAPAQITAACIGLAGVSHPDNHRKMFEAISAALPDLNFTLETDARIALAGATAGKLGVVIIAGTGSIAYGVNKDGEVARAGGWGPTLGDEGSATYIGRRALEAVMTAYDYRTHENTLLTEKICRFFNVSSPLELPAVIYVPNNNAMGEIAKLAKEVTLAAQEGDVTAIGILKDAAHELARAINAVITQLEMQHEEFRIGYVGGVFSAGEFILEPLREEISAFAPQAKITEPAHAPAVGAAQMAIDEYTKRLNQLLVGQPAMQPENSLSR